MSTKSLVDVSLHSSVSFVVGRVNKEPDILELVGLPVETVCVGATGEVEDDSLNIMCKVYCNLESTNL